MVEMGVFLTKVKNVFSLIKVVNFVFFLWQIVLEEYKKMTFVLCYSKVFLKLIIWAFTGFREKLPRDDRLYILI